MGFEINTIELLLAARTQGVDFSRTATLGRQEFYRVDGCALRNAFREWWGVGKSPREVERLLTGENGFVDLFLRELGAEEITAIDASAFEGATVLHDMNIPTPSTLNNRFTVVIDGGLLEHVYNFPVAIHNCMQMVRVGGHFLTITPTNNFMGHGFYQFSPELFYRVFRPQNGFVIERMILFESRHKADWYEVADPGELGRRVEFVNHRPTFLYVQARKCGPAPIVLNTLHESSYVSAWTESPRGQGPVGHVAQTGKAGFWTMLRHRTPGPLNEGYQVWRMLRRFRKNGLRKLDRRSLVGPHVRGGAASSPVNP
jgi:hypothetical protein